MLKRSASHAFFEMFGRIFGFVLIAFLANVVNVDDLGSFISVRAWALQLAQFLTLGLSFFAARYVSEFFSQNDILSLSIYTVSGFACSLITGAIFTPLVFILVIDDRSYSVYFLILGVFVLYSWSVFLMQVNRASVRDYFGTSYFFFFFPLIQILILFIYSKFAQLNLLSLLALTSASLATTFLIHIYSLRSRVLMVSRLLFPGFVSKLVMFVRQSWSSSIFIFCNSFLLTGPLLSLSIYGESDELVLFQILLLISTIPGIMTGAVFHLYLPRIRILYTKNPSLAQSEVGAATLISLTSGLLGCAGVVLLYLYVLDLFFPFDFSGFLPVLITLLAIQLFLALWGLGNALLALSGHSKIVNYTFLVGALFAILLGFFGYYILSLFGLAFASALTLGGVYAVLARVAESRLNLKLGLGAIRLAVLSRRAEF